MLHNTGYFNFCSLIFYRAQDFLVQLLFPWQHSTVGLRQHMLELLFLVRYIYPNFSHEIVKGLLFDMPETEPVEDSEKEIKPIEPAVLDEKTHVSPDVSHLEKDELVALSPEEPFKHAGSDVIEKALQALDNRVSAESGQSGPSDNPTQDSPKQGSVEKLNEMIKQYNQ